ncbi:MAG: hypothetical protein Q9201_000176 [Fulgogasparrea decipioides]
MHRSLIRGDQCQLGVTEQVIERAAFYEQRLQTALQDEKRNDWASGIRRLSNDYYILRITLAWHQDRLDLAEILLAKLSPEQCVVEASVAESLADVLFEIGRDQATKQQYKPAIQWLERAHDVLMGQTSVELSTDASEMRSCIMHNIVRILLKEPSEETTRKAWNIIHDLEGEIENPLAISLLKLELLAIDQAATQDYQEVLVQIVRQIHLSDMNVRTILHHVHELRRRSAHLAHGVLVELLTERLLAMDETAWVEKTLVTLVWNCTASKDIADTTDTLVELLDTMVVRSVSAIGTSATHAAQIESTLLYACVLEAQKNGDRQQVIRALSRVREKNSVAPTPGLHLPALLRLTARMLMQELEAQQSQDTASINELCKVFEGGKMQPKPSIQVVDHAFPAASTAKASRRDPSSYGAFPVAELDWFSCNIYNLALKMCTQWKAEATLRLVQACLKVGGRLYATRM